MRALGGILAAVTVLLTATAVDAATGVAARRLSLHAGPGNDYPRIDRIPRDARVAVHGCIRAYDWCDVTFRGHRGWVDGDSLAIFDGRRRLVIREYGARYNVPVVTFGFGDYWDSHYRGRPFYRDRDHWNQRARRDQDRDGVPDRFDRDRDGDGVRNRRDSAPNNPRRD
jgi:uncharacterized protein YraI